MTDTLPGIEPHEDIEKMFDDVHWVSGSVVFKPLIRLTRTMTIIRHDGKLTLINAVRLNDKARADLDALGKVENVVRVGIHGMDNAWYKREYGAKLWGLPGVKHAHGAAADEELSVDNLPFPNSRLFVFEHTTGKECALLLETNGGILLTCDSVQNWEHTRGVSLAGKLVTRLMGFMKPAQIGPPWRKMNTPEGGSLLPDFERMLKLDFKHLVAGHGVPLKDVAKEKLTETVARVYA
jgi:hypothetical protein